MYFINNGIMQYFATDLKIYQSLRDYMIYNVYRNMDYVNEIMNIIAQKIDCLDISFDSMRYEINVNIKKTTMRRAKGYKASSMYYYGIMNSVFKDFFERHPEIFMQAQQYVNADLSIMDESKFDNICQVYCIGDKAVTIRL